jgi:hypothetical protein
MDDSGEDIPGVTPRVATMSGEIFTVLLLLHLESKVAYPGETSKIISDLTINSRTHLNGVALSLKTGQ